MKSTISLGATSLLIVMSSCVSVGPRFVSPIVAVPCDWEHPISAQISPKSSPEADNPNSPTATQIWWDQFTDSQMELLISKAQNANPSVHRARARIDEAAAQRDVIRAARYPHHDFTGDYNIGLGSFDDGLEINPNQPVYNLAQIDHGWSIDLFGERRRMVEATERNIEAQVEGWRDSYVFFTSEVALYYVIVRVAEARQALTQKKIIAYRQIENITRQLTESGLTSEVEATEAFARTKAEEAKIPRLQRDAALARLALSRVCATAPAEIESILNAKSTGIPLPPDSVSAPFPAQLLRNRPDIRRAERKIAQQVSQVGVATANFYPDFNLRGAVTYESLFRHGTEELLRHTIGGGGRLTQRLGHGGADQARLKEQEARLEIAVRDYEVQVLQALEEVESALTSIHYAKREIGKLRQAVNAQEKIANAMVKGFSEGLISNADLLRVQEERFETAEELLFAQNQLAKSAVALFEAIGGGKIPLPANQSAPMPQVTETEGNGLLSNIFSLGKDKDKSLHYKERNKTGRKWEMTKEGIKAAKEDDNWRMTSDGLRPNQ